MIRLAGEAHAGKKATRLIGPLLKAPAKKRAEAKQFNGLLANSNERLGIPWLGATMNAEAPRSVKRLADLANEIGRTCPNAPVVVRDMFTTFKDVLDDYRRPQPIATAPQIPERTLLLYCPEQGGWQTGEWLDERKCWVSTAAIEECLEPTLWTEVPPVPEEWSS